MRGGADLNQNQDTAAARAAVDDRGDAGGGDAAEDATCRSTSLTKCDIASDDGSPLNKYLVITSKQYG
jgi:hypothetical protein